MLEQQSGSPMDMVADDPRRSRLWTWQSVAHGVTLILSFRWRTRRFGGEQYGHGILDTTARSTSATASWPARRWRSTGWLR